jgi:hypothetical protein
MSWDALWALALKRFGAEDIQIRILIGLAVAFLILMIIEGLRACFRPGKPHPVSVVPPALKAPRIALAAPPAKPVVQPLRARPTTVRATPKRAKRAVNRQRPPLPKIRRLKSSPAVRTPTFTEEAAPYSPLSPNRNRDLL